MASFYITTPRLHTTSIYLPPEESRELDTRPLLLEHLQREDSLLYTEEQARVFAVARRTLTLAERGLGPIGYGFILIVPTLLTLFSTQVIHATTKDVLITTFLALVVSNVASMVLTGTLPNRSSNAQNKDQNVMAELKLRFDNFGKYLLLQYRKPEKKEEIITTSISIQQLLNVKIQNLKEATTQKMEVKETMRFLQDTLYYITSNMKSSANSELEAFLEILGLPYSQPLRIYELASL